MLASQIISTLAFAGSAFLGGDSTDSLKVLSGEPGLLSDVGRISCRFPMRAILSKSPESATAIGVIDSFARVTEQTYSALISKHKGKLILVNFWATWCSPCLEELPELVELEAELSSKGVKLITISADEPEQDTAATRVLNSIKVLHPRYLKDARDNDAFINGVDSAWSGALPALFIYDRAGKLVQKFVGEHEFEKIKAAVVKHAANVSSKK